MVAGRVGYKVSDIVKPIRWVDYLSGDANHSDNQDGAFDTLFATNHKFYGYMDRFLNVPAATNNGGLVDIAIKNKGNLGPGALEVAVHQFLLAQRDSAGNSGQIGFETDLAYALPLREHIKLLAGASGFIDQGDFKEARDSATLNPSACVSNTSKCTGARTFHDWFFLMLDVNL